WVAPWRRNGLREPSSVCGARGSPEDCEASLAGARRSSAFVMRWPGCGRGLGTGEGSARVGEPGLLNGDRLAVAEHAGVHDQPEEEGVVSARELGLHAAFHVPEARGDQRRARHAVAILEL